MVTTQVYYKFQTESIGNITSFGYIFVSAIRFFYGRAGCGWSNGRIAIVWSLDLVQNLVGALVCVGEVPLALEGSVCHNT